MPLDDPSSLMALCTSYASALLSGNQGSTVAICRPQPYRAISRAGAFAMLDGRNRDRREESTPSKATETHTSSAEMSKNTPVLHSYHARVFIARACHQDAIHTVCIMSRSSNPNRLRSKTSPVRGARSDDG